jgi:hypothetical protein
MMRFLFVCIMQIVFFNKNHTEHFLMSDYGGCFKKFYFKLRFHNNEF